jgi:peroxiredoxin Q/BCP
MSLLPAGSQAPAFDLPAHDGSRVRLADLAGKYVLLWFYPAADTPG